MNFRKIASVLIVVVFTTVSTIAYGYTIKGVVKSDVPLETNQILLQGISPYGSTVLDTTIVNANGEFLFNGTINEKSVFYIGFSAYKNVYIIADNDTKVNLTIDITGFKVTYSADKGSETDELSKIANMVSAFNNDYLTLEATYKDTSFSIEKRNEAFYQKYIAEGEWGEKQTAQLSKTKSLHAKIFAIEMLGVQAHLKVEEQNIAQINASKTTNNWFDYYKTKAVSRMATAIGQTAPGFSMPTPQGDTLGLADLKGKYVFVDFWASWCKPCRVVNPYLVTIYDKYKDKNIEFLGVSFDKFKHQWEGAIAQDNLAWKQISDLKGWQSYAAQLYGINSIPSNVLIDKNGVIIAKNIPKYYLDKKLQSLTQ